MAGGFPAWKLTALCVALLLAACVGIGTEPSAPSTPEEELAMQARALQRTVQEAAIAGATAGAGGVYLFGGKGPATALGIVGGIPIGVAAGSYVGFLQQQYASKEARLERLRADIDQTNAETAATIRTMQLVLARQTQVEAVRSASAPASLNSMALAIDGAQKRRAEFESTRALGLVSEQRTGVDPQIEELSARIADMQMIAAQLAGNI
jgi:gas vesicle protein